MTVFPPFSALDLAAHKFKLGAQNFYPCESGAHTGEIGKAMLDEFGVKSVLIGHSERRELGESEELLRAKFDFAVKAGWQIVYCIGENLSVNEAGGTKEVLAEQLKNIELGYERLLIAYEPIWAIGTGDNAKPVDVKKATQMIRQHVAHLYGKKAAEEVRILYGGSITVDSAADYLAISGLDGLLVGAASLDIHQFTEIIEKAHKG